MRGLAALPPALQVWLARGSPLSIDGQTLDPGFQLLTTLMQHRALVIPADPLEMRQRSDHDAVVFSDRDAEDDIGPIRDVTIAIDSQQRSLAARHYFPSGSASANTPLLLYFHGGGFVYGNLDTHDAVCRRLCRVARMPVLAVEYRLVPEHRYPDAINDAIAAFRWAHEHARELGSDGRVAVGGDSAGGNLSAVISQQLRDARDAKPIAQLLIYPAVDRRPEQAYPSLELFAEGFFLTRAAIEWFHGLYSADVPRNEPRISPAAHANLSGLPPALVVTAGFDPLRDEGNAYARSLRAAGTPSELICVEGLVHGFLNMTVVNRASLGAAIMIAERWREFVGALPR